MSSTKSICTDAASENCPCYLANTGNCLICGRLNKKDKCQCDWCGVCIFSQLNFNDYKLTNRRKEIEMEVIKREYIHPDFMVMTVSAPVSFVIRTMMPGSYVFMRNPDTNHFFDAPISVISANITKATFNVGIRIISSKTKSLTECSDKVLVRGPYRNGIEGFNNKMTGQDILILAKGAGVCPAIMAVNCLSSRNNVTLAVHDGELERKIMEMEEITNTLSTLSNPPSTVIILGCSSFCNDTKSALQPLYPAATFHLSRNDIMCCGEGICGACGKAQTPDGLAPLCKLK